MQRPEFHGSILPRSRINFCCEAFVSAVVRQLAELPLVFHSTAQLEQNLYRPHHGIPPDRNQGEIIGVNLPAFLLSKNKNLEPVKVTSKEVETK